jgi:hypothetical protein
MKKTEIEPENIQGILSGYEKINDNKRKIYLLYQAMPDRRHQEAYTKIREEWLKFRDKYKAIINANMVKNQL